MTVSRAYEADYGFLVTDGAGFFAGPSTPIGASEWQSAPIGSIFIRGDGKRYTRYTDNWAFFDYQGFKEIETADILHIPALRQSANFGGLIIEGEAHVEGELILEP